MGTITIISDRTIDQFQTDVNDWFIKKVVKFKSLQSGKTACEFDIDLLKQELSNTPLDCSKEQMVSYLRSCLQGA